MEQPLQFGTPNIPTIMQQYGSQIHNNSQLDIALVLYSGMKAGINGKELVSLLNKSLDISNNDVLIKKMEVEHKIKIVNFDYYFIISGTLFSIIGIIMMLYYLQTLIISCSGSFVSLVGTGAKYGVGGVELIARNTVPFFWNNLLLFGNKIGNITNTFNISDSYKFSYANESIVASPINQTVEVINANAELASLIVNIMLFIILMFVFTLFTIFLLKITQLKKFKLSFLLWKMDTELRS
jgi:hypothetical protein